jgi:hypothetical protein
MLAQSQIQTGGFLPYVAGVDFGAIFTGEIHSLHLLSFLLTADTNKAERCFIGGLGEFVEEMGEFIDWTRFGARRAIIRQAIRMITPAPENTVHYPLPALKEGYDAWPDNTLWAAIVSLCAFERFVFVMSTLERLPDEECIDLLECSHREFACARELAAGLIPTIATASTHHHGALHASHTSPSSPHLA